MKKFNLVKIKGATRRQNFYDQLLDVGTPDDRDIKFYPAFMGASLARRFNPDYNVLRQLIAKNNANIWFFCLPRTQAGAKLQARLSKSGKLTRIPLTKNVMYALGHNRGMRRPALGIGCKVLIVLDKNPKLLKNSKLMYSHISSQPIILGELYMSVTRHKQEARKITRGK